MRAIWLLAAGTAAALVALELVRPFAVGPVGFDSAASVIYFDRIVEGRRLEAFITATPKPLLTVVYGALHGITDDWRPVSWAAVAAYATSVALAGWLVTRVAGAAAGAFAAVALLASRALLADVAIAYAVPWAMVCWMAAGLALTAERRRYVLAGAALALASLARLETLVVVVAAAAAIALAWILARLGRLEHQPERSWWLVPAIGLLALPGMLLHDWLLTGDPLFWASVSTRFSEAAPDAVMTPLELAGTLARRYLGTEILSALAVAGTIFLLVRRCWVPLVGLAALGPGIAAFLVVLAMRGTYVSTRYFAVLDVALVLAAAIGTGAIVGWIAARRWPGAGDMSSRAARWRQPVMMLAALLLAVVASRPVPSLDASFRAIAGAPRLQAERDALVAPTLDCALDAIPGSRDYPPPTESFPPEREPTSLVLLVAGLERPRFSVDLDVPLDKIGGTPAEWVEPGSGFLPHGRLLFHDRRAARDDAYAALEVAEPTTYGATTLVPLKVDEAEGVWVQRIDRAEGPSGGPSCEGAGS